MYIRIFRLRYHYIQIFELETKAQLSEKPPKRFRAQQNLILGKKADGLLLEKTPNLVKISTSSEFDENTHAHSVFDGEFKYWDHF